MAVSEVVLYPVATGLILLGLAAQRQLRRDPQRLMRGRWVSRPLLRAVGPARAFLARLLLVWLLLPVWLSWALLALLTGPDSPALRLLLALGALDAVWDIDDWLTGDDDGRRRRPLEWARVRLTGALRPLGYSTSTGRA